MALSIGVTAGSQIRIGKSVLKVVDITSGLITVKVGNGPLHVLSDKERAEVLPNVFVFVGDMRGRNTGSRLAFEAPRSVPITRVEGVHA